MTEVAQQPTKWIRRGERLAPSRLALGLEEAVDLLEVEDAQHAGIQPFLGDGPLLNGGEDGPVGCLQVLGQEQDVRPRLEGQQGGLAGSYRWVMAGSERESVITTRWNRSSPRSFWVIIS